MAIGNLEDIGIRVAKESPVRSCFDSGSKIEIELPPMIFVESPQFHERRRKKSNGPSIPAELLEKAVITCVMEIGTDEEAR